MRAYWEDSLGVATYPGSGLPHVSCGNYGDGGREREGLNYCL